MPGWGREAALSSFQAPLTPASTGEGVYSRSGAFNTLLQLCRSSRWQDKGNSLCWGLGFGLDIREISFSGKEGQPCPKGFKMSLPSCTAVAAIPASGGLLLRRYCCRRRAVPHTDGKQSQAIWDVTEQRFSHEST